MEAQGRAPESAVLDIFKPGHQLKDNFIGDPAVELRINGCAHIERNAHNVSRNAREGSVVKVNRYYRCFRDAWCKTLAFKRGPNLLKMMFIEQANNKS